MALNLRNEPDAPGAEYPLIQQEPHENVVNETEIHFAQSDAELDEEAEMTDEPLLSPADEAAQRQQRQYHVSPATGREG